MPQQTICPDHQISFIDYCPACYVEIEQGGETKSVSRLTILQLAELAFVVGYFNQQAPPAYFVSDIADGNLTTAWERCKPFIIQHLNRM